MSPSTEFHHTIIFMSLIKTLMLLDLRLVHRLSSDKTMKGKPNKCNICSRILSRSTDLYLRCKHDRQVAKINRAQQLKLNKGPVAQRRGKFLFCLQCISEYVSLQSYLPLFLLVCTGTSNLNNPVVIYRLPIVATQTFVRRLLIEGTVFIRVT